MKKAKQQKHQICNSENYALMRDKGFSNREIEAMWGVPRMAVAAYQAWNTMGGKKWNTEEQDLNTIHLGHKVCQNTLWHGQEAVDPVGRVFPNVDIDPLSI